MWNNKKRLAEAVVRTEMVLRTKVHLWTEMVAYCILPERLRPKTIGLSQLGVQLWKEYLSSHITRREVYAMYVDFELNVNAVEWFLANQQGRFKTNSVSGIYTGGYNRYYESLLRRFYFGGAEGRPYRKPASQKIGRRET